ncbi:MAG: glycosyltransferase [Cyclobacteriaceae bacterium]|nr:glycosyltransferase [Cyclobacteriaceae bacterium]
MNIVMVLPYLKAGGTERQASYITNHLFSKGHEVATISIERTDSFEDFFKGPVIYLNSKNTIVRLASNLYSISRKLKKLDSELIVSRAWTTNLLSALLSFTTGKPAVLFLSGSIDLSGSNMIKRRLQSWMMKQAEVIISVSEASKKNCIKWLHVSEHKIKVIHNGVDTEEIIRQAAEQVELPDRLDNNLKTIAFVGRLVPRKGLDVLLKALKNSLKSGIHLNLIVVGDGENKSEYVRLTKELGIERNVFFIGQKKNPFPYIKFSDIFVLPSRSEGFPNALLEAMALSKPVIASDCETGPREIINNNNGTLVQVNDPENLSQKILNYALDETLRINHGKNGYQTVIQDFNLASQMNRIEMELQSVYSDL